MPSALEVITRAYRIAGVTGQSETLTAQEAADGLVALNDLIDSMNLNRSFIYTIENEDFNLVSGQLSYTIGSGGDFNTTRPIKFDSVTVYNGDSAYPQTELSAAEYEALPEKDDGLGIPEYYYIDNDFPTATIKFYPVPTSSLTVTLGKWKPVSQFADLTTQYTFPPGYNRAFNYGLAVEIGPENGMPQSQQTIDIARRAIANVKNRNLPKRVMNTEISMLSRHRGDIFAGH